MNINTIRDNLALQIQAIYQSGLDAKDTAAVTRGEMNVLLDQLQILEKELPAITSDPVYTETARHVYETMLKYWSSNCDDIYRIIETINHCRFNQMTTPLQMWTRLREFAAEVDKQSTLTRKEKILKSIGVKRKPRWLTEVDNIHPEILEGYRKRNAEIANENSSVAA